MNITLPKIISSGMVITKNARIWGWCEGHQELRSVNIYFCGKHFAARVKDGKWEVFIESEDFGGPFEMRIEDIVLTDIYIGYVFMLNGQSNMEMPVSRVKIRYGADFTDVRRNPKIRAFQVLKEYDFSGPRDDCEGQWRALDPKDIGSFYAISYYLSQNLQELNAPIGFIECAAGGSTIESWLSEEVIRPERHAGDLLALCKRDGLVAQIQDEDAQRAEKWQKDAALGDIGFRDGFHAASFNHSGWPTRGLTKSFDGGLDLETFYGCCWFRKTFTVPADMAGKSADIYMGTITDSDIIYINGEEVGRTEYQYPPRAYPIREGLLREGENTAAIRITCERGFGGFTAGKEYCVENDGGRIDLDGDWHYKTGHRAQPLPPSTWFFAYPCGLYNAMLKPVLPFSISAYCWYQGESNGDSPHNYSRFLARFISGLRANYGDDLPFLLVQLPNYGPGDRGGWPLLRKHQSTVLDFKAAALIITDDIGEDNDLHPLNKRDVGHRLALGIMRLLKGAEYDCDKVVVNK